MSLFGSPSGRPELQWPTVPTLVMFPTLEVVYTRLARAEEREVAARFGATWRDSELLGLVSTPTVSAVVEKCLRFAALLR